jgi:RimJ/RimL family protein N-acetyltransferase
MERHRSMSPDLAQELDGAQRAAAQRVDGPGPVAFEPVERPPDIRRQEFWVEPSGLAGRKARQTDPGCSVTPLGRRGRLVGAAQIGPVPPLGVIARILERDAFRRCGRALALGTAVAGAVCTRAMQRLIGLGYRSLKATCRSDNAASLQVHRKLGWQVGPELERTFVRRL